MAGIPSYGKIHGLARNRLLDMNDETLNPGPAVAKDSQLELLARQTGTPVETVQEIYRAERDKLESSARIKTFVSVLAHQRVKALLQEEHGRRH